MCGIAGIIVKQNVELPNIQGRLRQMAQMMTHRGPDDEGLFVSPDCRIGLANRRLAIRDLSAAGHMPMCNASQTVWITFNGEIYNTDELRAELLNLDYVFKSNSDTEVILRGYEAWGKAIVERLHGMFALAIYDTGHAGGRPRVLLARDHMGIKPLYYANTAQGFVFASELKALLASGLVGREISATGLYGYLLTGSVPNPYTIYQNVSALPPANLLDIKLPLAQEPQPEQYWHLPVEIETNYKNQDEAVSHLRELLKESVRSRLVSDVPLGAFLSGGLDSSAVVALMRQSTSGDIRTCSIVFEEAAYSEAAYAQAVSNKVKTNHYERVVTGQDMVNEFDNILQAMDQPSLDGVNTYFVSQTARQAGLTVALSGLGGDELFGGYPNTFGDVPRVYHALKLAQNVPTGRWLAHNAINLFPQQQKWSRMRDALNRPASLASAYLTRRGLFSEAETHNLIANDILETVDPVFDIVSHVAARANGHTPTTNDLFAWVSRAELRTYTHHQLLRDTDVMSMAHSLEVRVPLLDRRLVEVVLRLPKRLKISTDGRTKPLLAEAVRNDLPDVVTQRRDKQGFIFPFEVWLRGSLRTWTADVLAEVSKQGWLQPRAVQNIHEAFQQRKIHWSRLWTLVALGSVINQ